LSRISKVLTLAPRDILLALIVVVVWGLNFVAIKLGVGIVPPLLMTALRYIFAALPAVFFVRRPPIALKYLLAYGFCVGVLQFGSLFIAIKLGMPASLSSLVVQMQAFFTIGFAVLFLGERPGWPQLAGAGLGLIGIVLIAAERFGGAGFMPLLLTLGAAAFWSIANIITKRAGRIDTPAFVIWGALVPPLPLIALSLLIEGPAADWAAITHPTWTLAGAVAFNAYAATIVGYGLWSMLLSRYPAAIVAPFSLLVPIVGITAGVVLLSEPLSLFEVVGSVVIFSGLLINVFGPRLLRRPGAAPV
jgi:O-acetylserine/cysteine efflux transporter